MGMELSLITGIFQVNYLCTFQWFNLEPIWYKEYSICSLEWCHQASFTVHYASTRVNYKSFHFYAKPYGCDLNERRGITWSFINSSRVPFSGIHKLLLQHWLLTVARIRQRIWQILMFSFVLWFNSSCFSTENVCCWTATKNYLEPWGKFRKLFVTIRTIWCKYW